jgi:hypothetical protein
MDSIIEIISKNIISNNKYNQKLKTEYVSTINRISTTKTNIMQLYRSMDYVLLYNTLYEEIIYLVKQQKYFNKHLYIDVRNVLDDYINERIELYNHYINKL